VNIPFDSDSAASTHQKRLVPTASAALAAGVTPATIRKWASRGRIIRYGTPQRALYDIDELMEALASAAEPPATAT
jgi:hypothetical protein